MYHDVYYDMPIESGFQNKTAKKYKISSQKFEEHVAAIDCYLRKKKISKSFVDFTFDDGGESFLTIIAPILEKYGFWGKFYISTNFIGTKGFLNTEQIIELHTRGHIIGSHSHTHPEKMSILDRNNLNNEWEYSQSILHNILGYMPQWASIPNGFSSKSIIRAMVSHGITKIDTSATTTHQSRIGAIIVRGRYAITENMSTDQVLAIVSSPLYRLKLAIRWYVLAIAKAILGNAYLSIRARLSK
jgi:peptidoglycan/xylan/chitin deacetylase (PgdA/CDA1 family)